MRPGRLKLLREKVARKALAHSGCKYLPHAFRSKAMVEARWQ
jgi:hypothetical protein